MPIRMIGFLRLIPSMSIFHSFKSGGAACLSFNRFTIVLGFDLPTGRKSPPGDQATDPESPYEGTPQTESKESGTDLPVVYMEK